MHTYHESKRSNKVVKVVPPPPQPLAQPTVQPLAQPTVQPLAQPTVQSSFLSTMADGIALGAGSSMGHRAVDSLLGPRNATVLVPNDPCKPELDKYIACITDITLPFCDDLHNNYVACVYKKT